MTTIKIIDQIKKRDQEAFEQIYEDYHRLIFYVINEIVKDKEISRDLVQETFLAVYNNIEQYNGGNFKYWIVTIAKNRAINYYNRVIKKEREIIRDNELVEASGDTSPTNLGKYDELLNKHFTQEEKDIIVYHVVFDYSYKEIAELLNQNVKTVGKKCRRLLSILKKIVKEE